MITIKKTKKKIPLVLGLIGEAGSGKDTAASYIKKKYNAEEFRFSYMLVNALKILGIPISRQNLAWLADVLKKKYGNNVLTRAMEKTIKVLCQKPIIVINGLRLPSDYDFIRRFPKNKVIFLTAPEKIRWKRVYVRHEKADDKVPFEEFLRLSSGRNEKYIKKIGKKADYVVVNDGDIDKFYKAIDHILLSIKK